MRSTLHYYLFAVLGWYGSLVPLSALSQATDCGGDIVLTTQAEVDAFNCASVKSLEIKFANGPDPITSLDNLSSLEKIEGDLNIGDHSLEDLGLRNLTEIGGDLFSYYNFNGLGNLKHVGGTLSIIYGGSGSFRGLKQLETIQGTLSIFNATVENFHGLERLTSIGGFISVNRNFADLSFEGLSALESVRGFSFDECATVDFVGLPSLQKVSSISATESSVLSFKGLENIEEMQEGFSFFDSGVSSWEGLGNLRQVGGDIDFERSSTLDFVGLDSLREVRGTLSLRETGINSLAGLQNLRSVGSLIIENAGPSLSGLQQLRRVNGDLRITDSNIRNISFLQDVEVIAGDLVLFSNSNLSDCCLLPTIADRVQGAITLGYNAPECNEIAEITSRCEETGSPITANAGNDKNVASNIERVILRGRAQGPYPFRRYRWEQVSGPDVRTESANTANVRLFDLLAGTYVFRFTATDSQGNSGSDEMMLTVTGDESPDQPIVVATAGQDRTVSLGSEPVRLYGSGTGPFPFRRYAWEQVSGPSARLENQRTANLRVYDLSVGTYVFRFTATDSQDNSGSDEVALTVTGSNTRLASGSGKTTTVPSEEAAQLSAYPNPAHDYLTVRLPANTSPTGVLTLTDLAGRQVQQATPLTVTTSGPLQIDVRRVPAGIYLLRWQTDRRYTTRVVVGQ